MPPVPPPADAQNSYLCCHFRPEFLPEFALSSDAFSDLTVTPKLPARR